MVVEWIQTSRFEEIAIVNHLLSLRSRHYKVIRVILLKIHSCGMVRGGRAQKKKVIPLIKIL